MFRSLYAPIAFVRTAIQPLKPRGVLVAVVSVKRTDSTSSVFAKIAWWRVGERVAAINTKASMANLLCR